jgi:transposase InsO family protein
VIGWGWFYPSTVLDDFSHRRLEAVRNMRAEDATATLDLALQASGLHEARPKRLRLLSDNGSSYVAGDSPNGSTPIRSSIPARPITR